MDRRGPLGPLSDHRLAKDGARFPELLAKHSTAPDQQSEFADSLVAHMLNTDPPDHTRLRRLVGKAFTGRAIARMRTARRSAAGRTPALGR